MRIRHAEPFSYGRGCFHKVPVSVNDEHVGGVCRPAVSVDKPERFPRLVKALRVGAPPPSLLQDDEQRVTVLENWMADGSFFDAAGVHSVTAGWAKAQNRRRLNGDGFDLALDLNVRNNYVRVFKVEQICDTIHVSSFRNGYFPQKQS
jgi:hypothetical protein